MVESFLLRKVYQIIAVMDSRGSNTTASNMPILIGIPKVQTFTVNLTVFSMAIENTDKLICNFEIMIEKPIKVIRSENFHNHFTILVFSLNYNCSNFNSFGKQKQSYNEIKKVDFWLTSFFLERLLIGRFQWKIKRIKFHHLLTKISETSSSIVEVFSSSKNERWFHAEYQIRIPNSCFLTKSSHQK
jgi:hypothetical protein